MKSRETKEERERRREEERKDEGGGEKVGEREREREKEIVPILWFIPQMPVTAWAGGLIQVKAGSLNPIWVFLTWMIGDPHI